MKDENAQPSYAHSYSEGRGSKVKMIGLVFAGLALVISANLAHNTQNGLATTITWQGGKNMFGWPLNENNLENEAATPISTTSYNLATRTVIYENYAFLAYPRSESLYVSITLAKMKLAGKEHRQYPFPNLEMQERDSCRALQDVIDIFIDPQGLLWALDAGHSLLRILEKYCEPKIVAFNATTGEEVRMIYMSDFERNGRGVPQFSRMVVDYDQEGDAVVYVSDIINRQIFVISGSSCIDTIQLPDSDVLDRNSYLITLNLVRKGRIRILLINDEQREQMFYLRPGAVEACCKLPENLLREMGPSDGTVILGNDDLSTVYYCEKSNRTAVYKYDALNEYVPKAIVYDVRYPAFPRHIVPDYTRGRMRSLESNLDTENSALVASHSLKLI